SRPLLAEAEVRGFGGRRFASRGERTGRREQAACRSTRARVVPPLGCDPSGGLALQSNLHTATAARSTIRRRGCITCAHAITTRSSAGLSRKIPLESRAD